MTTSQVVLEETDFGPVMVTEERIQHLRNLVHSHSRLQKAGYVLWPFGQADLDKKKRCGRCTKVIRKGHEKQKSRAQSVKLAPTMAQRIAAEAYARRDREQESTTTTTTTDGTSTPQSSHARSVSLQANSADISDLMQDMTLKKDGGKDGKETGPPMNCKYHPGRLWTCCGNNLSGPPCAAEQFHTTRVYRRGELESNWQYFSTPHPPSSTLDPCSPPVCAPNEHVAAVVLDCEMGTAASGESELIRVSAIDFFSRRVLVDSLVWPDVKMAHFNTRYSGVSRASMDAARRGRRTLAGRGGARAALWRFVGPQTVVVGHSANSDLNALRWIHALVIDTLLLEMRIQPREERPQSRNKSPTGEDTATPAKDERGGDEEKKEEEKKEEEEEEQQQQEEEKKPKYPGLSLKALTAERLQREIQIKGQGHDSLEDALATRDLLLWHLIHKPEPPIFY